MQEILYSIKAEQYHKDLFDDNVRLSSSITKTLWTQTPKHAWMQCPKLNPLWKDTNKKEFDLGTAAHKILLEGSEKNIVVIDASDYRNKEAREARDLAYAEGKVPILKKVHNDVLQMANEARWFISRSEIGNVFENGHPEVTVIFDYHGIPSRARIDWLTTGRNFIIDYKTTTNANPDVFSRVVSQLNYDMQVELYLEGNRVTGGDPNCKWLWLVQEAEKPYACSLVSPSNVMLEMANHKVTHVAKLWAHCLKHNDWPAYRGTVSYIDPKPWDITQVEQAILY